MTSTIHIIAITFATLVAGTFASHSPAYASTQPDAGKSSTRYSARTLAMGVEKFLRNRLQSTDNFEISQSISDQAFDEAGITARCEATAESLRGSTRIQVVFSKESEVLRRIYVPVRITRIRNAYLLTRSIRKGETLRESDIEQKLSDVTYMQTEPATDLVGKRALFSMPKGAILADEHVASAGSIQRGDAVTLNVTSGGVVIRTIGTAMDDAEFGQSVRVRRADSAVILSGTASENKTVTLALTR
jgi:flagella basal body P-ring formation protein FlgA